MAEQPFTNREIKAMLENIGAKMEEIHAEVKFTNGKVKSLMAWREQIKGASTVVKGAWGVAGVFLIAMTFGVFNMYVQVHDLPTTVQVLIEDELQNYEFEISK